ncbi:MAG: peptidoglycan DD-metalloendopeptidase family protein [Candidatus Firestonebacteria bacterium]
MKDVITLIIAIFISVPFVFAVDLDKKIDDYKGSIEKTKENFNKLEKKIEAEETKKQQAEIKEKGILGELEKVEKQIDFLEKQIATYNLELTVTEEKIKITENELQEANDKLSKIRKKLHQRLRVLYKHGKLYWWEILLTSQTISQFLNRYKFMQDVLKNTAELKKEVEDQKIKIENKKRELEYKKARYKILKELTLKKQSEATVEKKRKEVLLVKIRKEKQAYQQAIAELEEASKELLTLVKKLETQVGSYEEQKTLAKLGFEKSKGKLMWPVKGKVVSNFGSQKHKKFNISVFNKGIEISSSIGQSVDTVSTGVVIYADWFKGYGKMIILDHGANYYTIYGHLSEITVSLGERVEIGKSIGLVGDTSSLYGAALYFEIRKQGTPLDPLKWLKNK